ncbi:MAG: hypothetical protein RLZ81_3066 [Pseudomonadota bacterium]|jgi:RimJ/RimL family protein N-acetyltransferase
MSDTNCGHHTHRPSIRKAERIKGQHLTLRNAAPSDAAFILGLRTNDLKARFLSATSTSLDDQRQWLEKYSTTVDQAYFVVEGADGDALGTVRLYDPRGDSFCWGSWIIRAGAPASAAIESALIVYHYALDVLGFTAAHFDVRRGNERVWSFHERFGAHRIRETAEDYDYEISNEAIRSSLRRYARFLPKPIDVQGLIPES